MSDGTDSDEGWAHDSDEEAQLAAVLALLTLARSPAAGQGHGLAPLQRWRAQRAAALARDAAGASGRPPSRRA
jgi:hypothetical protein